MPGVAVADVPLRKTIKDHFLVCESLVAKAICTAQPYQIEALDMRARRCTTAFGSSDRLAGAVATDFDTARRLFTLVCVLQMRG